MAASPYPSPKKFPALPTSLSRLIYVRHRYNFRAHIDLRHYGRAFVAADTRRAELEKAKTATKTHDFRAISDLGGGIPLPAQDAGKAPENANTEGGERRLYSERLSYNEQLNQLWEGKLDPKYTHIRIMQNTPEILIKHAGAKDKPVMMKRHSFELELFEEGPREGNYHGLGYDVMEKLPDMMSNPVLIYKRSDGRIIEISRYSSPEKNLLLSIELDSEFRYVGDDGESWGDFNIVITAFNLKDRYLKGQLSRDGNEFLYPTKKEDISSAMSGLFAYPGDNKDTSSVVNIPPTDDGSQVLFSARDSAGRDLSPEQQEFFKDSQVRDEQGNLKVMYHGTPYGGFTVFRDESYFTDNKGYADRYHNPSASSSYKPARADEISPETYAVYLNITQPFDTRNAKERNIFYHQFYRQWGNGAPLSESGLPDWTDASDLIEFISENDLPYDGIILICLSVVVLPDKHHRHTCFNRAVVF